MALREEQRRWDQDGLRPSDQSWHLRGLRRKAPSPFDEQDVFDAFVGRLREKIQDRVDSKLSDPVQREIAALIRLLGNTPRAVIYQNRALLEMAFELLAAKQPNLVLASELRQSLIIAKESSTWFGRLIIRQATIQTVLLGILSTFLLLFAVILALDQLQAILEPSKLSHPMVEALQRIPMVQVITLLVAAVSGAVVSVLARLRYFLEAARTAPFLVYVTVSTKPLVSIAFALFVYAVMGSGLIALPSVSLSGPDGTYLVWALGFLSGFSERFVQDFVAEADRIVGPDLIGNPAPKNRSP